MYPHHPITIELLSLLPPARKKVSRRDPRAHERDPPAKTWKYSHLAAPSISAPSPTALDTTTHSPRTPNLPDQRSDNKKKTTRMGAYRPQDERTRSPSPLHTRTPTTNASHPLLPQPLPPHANHFDPHCLHNHHPRSSHPTAPNPLLLILMLKPTLQFPKEPTRPMLFLLLPTRAALPSLRTHRTRRRSCSLLRRARSGRGSHGRRLHHG